MPHRIDLDSIHQELFLLLNLAYAAPVYSKRHPSVFQQDIATEAHEYYVHWLRFILSEKLLIIAVKVRVVLDMLQAEENFYFSEGEDAPFNIATMQKRGIGNHKVGNYVKGKGACDLRDCCNRIVHADEIIPEVVPSPEIDNSDIDPAMLAPNCWSGSVNLSGRKGHESWVFSLVVSAFCITMERFLNIVENDVDWHRMYKYDELI